MFCPNDAVGMVLLSVAGMCWRNAMPICFAEDDDQKATMKALLTPCMHSAFCMEALESRQLLSYNWGPQAIMDQQDQLVADFPYLDGSNEAIALVDSGVDYNHPVFGDAEFPNSKIIAGWNFVDNNADPMDELFHGTGVAGLIGGNFFQVNGYDYQGIAQNIGMIALRQDSGATIKQSLDWVIVNQSKYNIQVVNLTDFQGGGASPTVYQTELQTLYNMGVFICTPVGNSGASAPIGYPAASPYVCGVGGLDQYGNFDASSQTGPACSILAPASNIAIALYLPASGSTPAQITYVNYAQGTSWSSAQVAAAAAIIKQINPNFTPPQIIQILQQSGRPVVDSANGVTYPALQLDAAAKLAFQEAEDPLDANNRSAATAAPLQLTRSGTYANSQLKVLIGHDDYYSFSLTRTGNVNFAFGYRPSHFNPFPTTQLLNSNGRRMLANLGTGGTQTLAAGTYVIKLHSAVSLKGYVSMSVNTNGAGAISPARARG